MRVLSVSGALFLGAAPAAQAAISWQFNYLDEAGFGFNDAALGDARKTALETAGAQFSNLFASSFSNSATLVMDVVGEYSGGNVLAWAGSSYWVEGDAPGLTVQEVVRVKLLDGIDLNGSAADGEIGVNFSQSWEFDLNAPVGYDQFDFYSTLYHEFVHTLGFASTIDYYGDSLTGYQDWAVFDSFLGDVDGTRVIDGGFNLDLTLWESIREDGPSPTGGLFFWGANAMAANGGNPIGIYSPEEWEEGSSGSHIDDLNPVYDGLMMLASTGTGPSARTLSAIEIAMLQDLGYTLAAPVPEPKTYAMMLAGLALLGWAARRRAA